MTDNLPARTSHGLTEVSDAEMRHEFVTMFVDGQMFGIPVLLVQDVLGPQKITPVPLAPKEVAGSLNLRGRIVTAIDVRTRLDVPRREEGARAMSIVVDHSGESYSLIVDQVGEVMTLSASDYEENPATLDERWRGVSNGIYRLKESLMIVLDIKRLLTFDASGLAA